MGGVGGCRGWVVWDGVQRVMNLRLPVVSAKFVEPAPMSVPDFNAGLCDRAPYMRISACSGYAFRASGSGIRDQGLGRELVHVYVQAACCLSACVLLCMLACVHVCMC